MGIVDYFIDKIKISRLTIIGGVLAYIVSLLHLFHPTHGFTKLIQVLLLNPSLILSDPRPLGFVIFSLGIILGVKLILLGYSKKFIYLSGMILMLLLLIGYFTWHLTGHGGFLPNRKPLYHGLGPLESVIDHITTDLWAAASKATEIILFVILGILYLDLEKNN